MKKRDSAYPCRIESRISELKFLELCAIKSKDSSLTMSAVIRTVLEGKPILVKTVPSETEDCFELLSQIYFELHKIGVNVNQVTKEFHQANQSISKFLLGKKLVQFQELLESEFRKIEVILSKLQDKWLSE